MSSGLWAVAETFAPFGLMGLGLGLAYVTPTLPLRAIGVWDSRAEYLRDMHLNHSREMRRAFQLTSSPSFLNYKNAPRSFMPQPNARRFEDTEQYYVSFMGSKVAKPK